MTDQTRITLKNVKHAEFASEETHCYEASVYFDGKRVGTVSNDGHGGADYQYPKDQAGWAAMLEYVESLGEAKTDAEKGQAIREWAHWLKRMGDDAYINIDQPNEAVFAQYENEEWRDGETVLQAALDFNNKSLECVCCDLVTDFLIKRDMKRAMARKVVFIKTDGKMYETKRAPNKAALAAWVEQIVERDDTSEVLNILPEADALKLYKEAA